MSKSISILVISGRRITALELSNQVSGSISDASVTVLHSVAEVLAWKHDNCFERLLILTDFWLPDGSALSVFDSLNCLSEQTQMIVLVEDYIPQPLLKQLATQAWLLLSHSVSQGQLIDMVKMAIADTASCFNNVSASSSYSNISGKMSFADSYAEDLGVTPRQLEVLKILLAGRSNKVIARELGIAEQTVKEHITRILAHFKVSNRLELFKHFSSPSLKPATRQIDYDSNASNPELGQPNCISNAFHTIVVESSIL